MSVVGQRGRGQIEQPGTDDAATPPHLGNVGHVELEFLGLGHLGGGAAAQDVEAFGDGLHHAVFDAVVDHLDKVAGADRPGVQIPLLHPLIAPVAAGCQRDAALAGGERGEDRVQMLERLARAADHQAVATLQPPHAAGGAAVEIVDAVLGERRGAADVVAEIAVAAVDHHVARTEQATKGRHRVFGNRARGQHHPHRARARAEPLHHVGQRSRGDGAILRQGLGGFGAGVEHHALVASAHQPARDIAAHPAQADHANLHAIRSRCCRGHGPPGWLRQGGRVYRDTMARLPWFRTGG